MSVVRCYSYSCCYILLSSSAGSPHPRRLLTPLMPLSIKRDKWAITTRHPGNPRAILLNRQPVHRLTGCPKIACAFQHFRRSQSTCPSRHAGPPRRLLDNPPVQSIERDSLYEESLEGGQCEDNPYPAVDFSVSAQALLDKYLPHIYPPSGGIDEARESIFSRPASSGAPSSIGRIGGLGE